MAREALEKELAAEAAGEKKAGGGGSMGDTTFLVLNTELAGVSLGIIASIGVSTTRRPFEVRSLILLKAPAGTDSSGHWISRNDIAPRSAPKRSGFEATTIVCVAIGFFCDSRLFARISA